MDVKAIDNKTTLLMYLVQQVEEKIENEFITSTEYEEMSLIAKLPISQLTIDLNELKKGLTNVKKAVESQTDEPSDKVNEILKPEVEKIQN